MTQCVDLHTHSNCSDGFYPPATVIEMAAAAGLKAVALTDHDSVEGLSAARQAGLELGVEVIAGIELSCRLDDKSVHVVGLMLEDTRPIQELLRDVRTMREQRMQQMIRNLNEQGIELSMADLPTDSSVALGRPHLVRAMLNKGYIRYFGEAFERLIGDDSPAYVPKQDLTVQEAIEWIHRSRGVAVLAHPGVDGWVESMQRFVGLGIDGIEAYHNDHSPKVRKRIEQFCKQRQLCISGGSDFHESRGRMRLGEPPVPESVLTTIFRRKEERWPASSAS